MILNISFFPNNDDQRFFEAYSKGGKKCCDKKVISKARSVGKEMIKVLCHDINFFKEIGRKILSGNFNLTRISFPIKISIPKTALETSIHGSIAILSLISF